MDFGILTKDPITCQMMAFTVPGQGCWHWNVLAQGLKVALSIFQCFMEKLLSPHFKFISVYIDDIIISHNSKVEYQSLINSILDLIYQEKLKVNKNKSILQPV
ncbi:hypothetical protein HK096_000781 [Nowakowskiella sp. JEL0078]|nr:hypothetical protein HK096_000781 [Nowakowskiella sp. JEL0078]